MIRETEEIFILFHIVSDGDKTWHKVPIYLVQRRFKLKFLLFLIMVHMIYVIGQIILNIYIQILYCLKIKMSNVNACNFIIFIYFPIL